MKLLSLEVRNFRVHDHVSLEFAPGHTVVVGPNEAGKSTLLEAMHSVLFLHHRTGGLKLESMRSRRGGHPEVVLCFEADGSRYRLTKNFRGSSGGCELLDQTGGKRWSSDEAEEQLRHFTGGEVTRPGSVDTCWSHLWAHQGQAAGDFVMTADLRLLQDALTRRAGNAGVSTLTQEDDRLLAAVEELVQQNWGKRGTPKESAEAVRRQRERDALAARLQQAQAALDGRRDLREQHVALQQQVRQHENALAEQGSVKDAKDREIQALTEQVSDQESLQAEHRRVVEELDKANEAVEEASVWRRRLQELQHQRQLKQKAIEQAAADTSKADARRTELQAGCRAAEAEERQLGRQSELAEAVEQLGQGRDQQKDLDELAVAYHQAQGELAAAEQELSAAQVVRDQDVEDLTELQSAQTLAEDRLSTVAARLTRLQGDGEVLVDGVELAVGQSLRIDQDVRIELPCGNVLQVRPGGEDLGRLRGECETAQRNMRDRLQQIGVPDLPTARQLRDRWAMLEKVRDLKRSRLQGMSDPEPKLVQLKARTAVLETKVARFRADGFEIAAGGTLESIARQLEEARQNRDLLSRSLSEAEQAWSDARKAEAEVGKEDAALAVEERDFSARMEQFEKTHGDPQQQQVWLDGLRQTRQGLTDKLAALQPARESLDRVKNEQQILTNAMNGQREMLRRDRERLAGLQALSSTEVDPQAEVEKLGAELGLAEERHRMAWRRMQGDKLLAETLTELKNEQQARREAPLLDAARRYLETAFGTSAGIAIEQEKDGKSRLGLVDRTAAGLGAFDFGDLSHGARELVALGMRLAMAEVIAAEQTDGCMPLVLDDAVTNVDPERIRQVGFMIGQATQRGVQVVLATCEMQRTAVFLAERTHVLSRRQPRDVRDPAPTEAASGVPGDDTKAFLDILQKLGGQASTRAMRDRLGWDTERFDAARRVLENQGLIRQPEGSRSLELADNAD